MAERFDDILNECTERILRGESMEQCLQCYPEQASELEPLLQMVVAARGACSAVVPRADFKDRVRYEVQSRIHSRERKPDLRRTSRAGWIPRWAVVAACVALVLVFTGGGTVAASSGSVPGDTLYIVKTTSERAWLKLTFSDAARAKLEAKFAERRVREMACLARKGRTAEMGDLTLRFEAHLSKIEQLSARIRAADAQDDGQISKIRRTLYRNMARDLAILDEAEAKAPGRLRSSIAVARFRLMQRYDEAIRTLDELQNRQAAQARSTGGLEVWSGSPGIGSGGNLRIGAGNGARGISGQHGQPLL